MIEFAIRIEMNKEFLMKCWSCCRHRVRVTSVLGPLVLIGLFIAFLMGSTYAAEHAAVPAAKKILLIGHQPDHPPGTHLYLPECELLARCLRQLPNVEATVSDGWPKDAKLLEDIDAIVLYTSPGADILLGGPHAEQVERLMHDGVGLVALHWATGVHGQKENEIGQRYQKHLGGLFCFAFSGLNVSKSRVEQIKKDHPICRGWSDFDLTDEYYLDLRFEPEATPLLNVGVQGKDQTVGWIYERPESNGGRSYGNTLGHFDTLFQRTEFRRMLVNGILWTAHYEIPSGGAPCTPSAG